MSDDIDKEIAIVKRGERWRIAKTTALLTAPALVVAALGLMLPIPPVACVLAIIGTGQLTYVIARWKWRLLSWNLCLASLLRLAAGGAR